MAQQAPELEQRVSELQSQIERLSASLAAWQQAQERLLPVEHQLSDLTQRGTEILDAWTTLSQRHAKAVTSLEARVSDLDSLDSRFEQDATQRLRELGRIIENEWSTLRQLHQQPVKELRDEAASLTEISLATASAAQTSLDRAEARLAALENTLHAHMAELARQVHLAIAEIRPITSEQALWNAAQPVQSVNQPAWPLDGVMRLHNQLRDHQEPAALTAFAATAAPAPPTPPELNHAGPALVERLESLERTLDDERAARAEEAAHSRRSGRTWPLAVVLAVAVAGAAWFGRQLQQETAATAARAAAAEETNRRAVEAANQRMADARAAAEREAAQARSTAARAQVVTDVLAAPDLIRIPLRGGPIGRRYSGQLLWSRSRGFVFSASNLPSAADGTYQLWLTTLTAPLGVGTFVPDATGRATLVVPDAPTPQGSVTGAMVTLEPTQGSAQPSGPTILQREP